MTTELRTPTGAPAATAASRAAADDLAVHALLNCCARESSRARLAGGTLRLPLGGGGELVADVAYASPALRHQYRLPARVVGDGAEPRPVGLAEVAALLADALSDELLPSGLPVERDALLARIEDSAANVAWSLDVRGDELDELWGPNPLPFARSEQALLVGHLVHPTPKSRLEMGAADRQRCSPELGAHFPLHWFQVDRSVLHHDSALPVAAPDLVIDLLRGDPAGAADLARLDVDLDRYALLPVHPWEAEHLVATGALDGLAERGELRPLGPLGPDVAPTTSVRTVHRASWPWMLKSSLHVRLTNSQRVTLPKELDRAVEAARLAASPAGARARRVAPRLTLLQDPAYLAVREGDHLIDGLSVLLRENRWGPSGPCDVTAVTTLCQDRPGAHGCEVGALGRAATPNRSGALVRSIAEREGVPVPDVARRWFSAFCDVTVSPLLRLYLDVGLCFEAHGQNTLVELEGGWPVRGVYRDSQGYFHREAAHHDLCQVVPGLGEASESIFPEALADERLTYYLFVNMACSVVNALGTAGCADEEVLLADLRGRVAAERRAGGRYPATLLDVLLDRPRLPCKANLLTRFHDMDELVGDISTQSRYGTVPNPLAEPAARG